MSKQLLAALVTVLFVGGFTPGTAFGRRDFKGVYEGPMADANGEVLDSESKIGTNGSYKVEIEGVTEDTTYTICLRFATTLGGAASDVFVEDVTVPVGETELKATGNLIDQAVLANGDNIYRPAFRVYTGGACDGTPVFESGLTVIADPA